MMKSPLDIIKSLAQQEKKAGSGEYELICPIFDNRIVVTSIDGLIYTFSIPQTPFGWWKFKTINFEQAKSLRPAEIDEIREYLDRLIAIRVVLSHKMENIYYGIWNNATIPVYLTDDMALNFDVIIGRFDGVNVWYDNINSKNNPAKANYLREAFDKMIDPAKIRFSGLDRDEKIAYAFRFSADKKIREELQKQKISSSVSHGGGKLISYHERSDGFSVKYTVEGHQYTSFVSKDASHTVITAGICLNGYDKNFDLKSLIGVLKEGHGKGLIHRT